MSYLDKNGTIRVELLDAEAEKKAESFIVYTFNRKNNEKMRNKKKSLSSAQLRKFFSEFRQLEKRVNAEKKADPEQGFYKVKPLIKMVKSKASYSGNPDNSKIPETFKNFIIDNVNAIDTEKDFRAFMLHFEAVVGFYYGMGVSNN